MITTIRAYELKRRETIRASIEDARLQELLSKHFDARKLFKTTTRRTFSIFANMECDILIRLAQYIQLNFVTPYSNNMGVSIIAVLPATVQSPAIEIDQFSYEFFVDTGHKITYWNKDGTFSFSEELPFGEEAIRIGDLYIECDLYMSQNNITEQYIRSLLLRPFNLIESLLESQDRNDSGLDEEDSEIEWQAAFDLFNIEALTKFAPDLINSVNDFSSLIREKVPDGPERAEWLKTFQTSLKGSAEKVGIMADSLESISNFGGKFGRVIIGSCLAYSAYRFLKNPTKATAIQLAICFIGFYYLYPETISDILSKFFELSFNIIVKVIDFIYKPAVEVDIKKRSKSPKSDQPSNLEFQSFFAENRGLNSDPIYILTPLLEWILDIGIIGKSYFLPIKEWSHLFRTAETLPKFVNSFAKKTTLLCDKIFDTDLSSWVGDRRDNPYFLDYEKRIKGIIAKRASGKLDLTMKNLNELSDLVDEGDKLLKSVPFGQEFNEMRKLIHERVNDVRRIEIEFRRANIDQSGFRQEPVGLLLRGGPGVQKSALLEHFAASANAMSLTPNEYEAFLEDPRAFTFNRQAENEYWEGYTNRINVVTFDDFGQMKDQAGQPDNEYMNLIRCINSFEMNLHMAGMDQKGKMRMNAKFVFANTNHVGRFSPQSIQSDEALTRRFHLEYVVVPKDQYCLDTTLDKYSRKIDYSKIEKVFDPITNRRITDPRPEHFHFYEVNKKNGEIIETQKPFTFDQVVLNLKELYDDRSAWKNRHVENFMKTSQNVRAQFFPNEKKIELQGGNISHIKTKKKSKGESFLDGALGMEDLDDLSSETSSLNSFCSTSSKEESEKAIEFEKQRVKSFSDKELLAIKAEKRHDFKIVSYNTFDILKNTFEVSEEEYAVFLELFERFTSKVKVDVSNLKFAFKDEPTYDDLEYLMFQIYRNSKQDFSHLYHHGYLPIRYASIEYVPPKYPGILFKTRKTFQQLWEYTKNLRFPILNFFKEVFSNKTFWLVLGLSTLIGGCLYGIPTFHKYLRKVPNPSKEMIANADKYTDEEILEIGWDMSQKDALPDIVRGPYGLWMRLQYATFKPDDENSADVRLHFVSDRGIIKDNSEVYRFVMHVRREFLENLENRRKWFENEGKFEYIPREWIESIVDEYWIKFYRMLKEPLEDIYYQMEYTHLEAKASVPKLSLRQMKQANAIKPQAHDPQGYDILLSTTRTNLVNFCLDDGDSPKVLGHALFVKSHCILLPRHFIDMVFEYVQNGKLRSDSKISLINMSGNQVGYTTPEKLIDNAEEGDLEDSHLAVVYIENAQDVRNIIDKFASSKQIAKLSSTFNVSLCTDNMNKGHEIFHSVGQIQALKATGMQVNKTIEYSCDTGTGDCGIPIFARTPLLGPNRIIGLHIAGERKGEGTRAYAGLIERESLEEAISLLQNLPKDFEEIPDPAVTVNIEPQSAPPYLSDRFRIIGTINNSHSPYGKTKIIKSPLHDKEIFEESDELPAMLQPTRGIDPFSKAIDKYCHPKGVLSTSVLDRACKDYFAFLNSLSFNTPRKDRRVLTTGEALWGLEEGKLNSIKCSTSAGYPYKFSNTHYKERFLGFNVPRNDENLHLPKLEKEIDLIEIDAKHGKRRFWCFTSNLKDERRETHKVLDGKTRLFSGAPFVYIVIFRKYFGAFMNWFYEQSAAQRIGSSIMINPYSNDWDFLAHSLKSFSFEEDPLVGAGDFSAFDGSEVNIIHDKILDYINEWYGDEDPGNKTIRKVLWKELTNSRHLFLNVVYEWHSSLPSGHPLTIIVNSMYNHLAFRYCFYSIEKFKGYIFSKYVCLDTVGDDNIFSVHPDISDYFNELTLPVLMKKVGLTYTTETKGQAEFKFRRLTEVNYLKRKFRHEPLLGRYVAPLLYSSIKEIPMWTKSGDSLYIFERNVEVYVRELSLHDSKFWDKKMERLRIAISTFYPDGACRINMHQDRMHYLCDVTHDVDPDATLIE